MIGHRTEAIYRRYAIVDEAMLREGAEKQCERVAHGEDVEMPVGKRERLPPGLDEREGRGAARLVQHPAARVQPDHARASGERRRFARHEARPGGHVQDLQAGPHPQPLQRLPPVERA